VRPLSERSVALSSTPIQPAGKAVDTQAASTAAGIGEQQRQYDLTRGDLLSQQERNRQDQKPWLDAGKTALGSLSAGIDTGQPSFNFDASKVQLDPGYQFGLQQGQLGIDRKTAAAGGRISGAALKAADKFGTDYATTGYAGAYNRQYGAATDTYNRANTARSDRLNRLAALAGIGQTSAQQVGANGLATAQGLASAGQNTANQISGLTTAQGNASAAGQLAQGNIWSGAGNQIAALYGRNNGGMGTYNPGGYSQPGGAGGDYYYGAGQNYGV
jgi:hypothetical protein